MAVYIDRMAVNAAIQKLISEEEDGWLDAAQLLVDQGRTLSDEGLTKYAIDENQLAEPLHSALVVGKYVLSHDVSGKYVDLVERHEGVTHPKPERYRILYDPKTFRAETVLLVEFRLVKAKPSFWRLWWTRLQMLPTGRWVKWVEACYYDVVDAQLIHTTRADDIEFIIEN